MGQPLEKEPVSKKLDERIKELEYSENVVKNEISHSLNSETPKGYSLIRSEMTGKVDASGQKVTKEQIDEYIKKYKGDFAKEVFEKGKNGLLKDLRRYKERSPDDNEIYKDVISYGLSYFEYKNRQKRKAAVERKDTSEASVKWLKEGREQESRYRKERGARMKSFRKADLSKEKVDTSKTYNAGSDGNIVDKRGRIIGVMEEGQEIKLLDGRIRKVRASGDLADIFDVDEGSIIDMVYIEADKYKGWIPKKWLKVVGDEEKAPPAKTKVPTQPKDRTPDKPKTKPSAETPIEPEYKVESKDLQDARKFLENLVKSVKTYVEKNKLKIVYEKDVTSMRVAVMDEGTLVSYVAFRVERGQVYCKVNGVICVDRGYATDIFTIRLTDYLEKKKTKEKKEAEEKSEEEGKKREAQRRVEMENEWIKSIHAKFEKSTAAINAVGITFESKGKQIVFTIKGDKFTMNLNPKDGEINVTTKLMGKEEVLRNYGSTFDIRKLDDARLIAELKWFPIVKREKEKMRLEKTKEKFGLE